MKPQSGRTIGLYFKVSKEEKEVIDQKMELIGTKNMRAYLRKMAVDGYIVHLDTKAVQELVMLLRSLANNTNQIARRCNETRNFYSEDMQDLVRGYEILTREVAQLKQKFEKL